MESAPEPAILQTMHSPSPSPTAAACLGAQGGAAPPFAELELAFRSKAAFLRLCLRWTRGNRSEAEDLFSDACLRVLEARHGGHAEAGRAPAFWVTVINNLGRDAFRRSLRWRFQSSGTSGDALDQVAAAAPSAEERLGMNERLAAAARALGHLSANQRAALLLRSHGVDYSTIGELLGVTPVNARKLVGTARHLLTSFDRGTARRYSSSEHT